MKIAALVVASFLALTSAAFAQATITYTDGEDDGNDYNTSFPNDPTTLSITSGSAIQSGVLSGDGAVEKTGAGTLNLTNSNTSTGPTSVQEGTLFVDGVLTSNVTVAAGASFGGDGIVDGDITLLSGSTFRPIDCFDANSLLWNADATMVFHIGDGAFDILELAGSLSKGDAGAFDFTFLDVGWAIGETYLLAVFDSTDFVESDFGVTNGGGFGGAFNLDDTQLSFTVHSVPEPSTWAMLGLGLVFLGAHGWHRRQRMPTEPA